MDFISLWQQNNTEKTIELQRFRNHQNSLIDRTDINIMRFPATYFHFIAQLSNYVTFVVMKMLQKSNMT